MSGTKLFIDTNIALYLLSGDNTISSILDGKVIYISVISELELLGFRDINQNERKEIELFLNHCSIIGLSEPIKKIRSSFANQ
jgi:predicted nucleic acid-binding protein